MSRNAISPPLEVCQSVTTVPVWLPHVAVVVLLENPCGQPAEFAKLTEAFPISVIFAIVWLWLEGANVDGFPVIPLQGTDDAAVTVSLVNASFLQEPQLLESNTRI